MEVYGHVIEVPLACASIILKGLSRSLGQPLTELGIY